MAKNKKGNAADSFFAGASADFETINTNNTHKQYTKTQQEQPAGFSIGQPQKEAKTKRVNLVLQPSLYAKAQAVADANGISFNEMVTQILRQITAGQ